MMSSKVHKQEDAEPTKEHFATPEIGTEDGSVEVGASVEVGGSAEVEEDVEMGEVAGQVSDVEQDDEGHQAPETNEEGGEGSANEKKKKLPDHLLQLFGSTRDEDGNLRTDIAESLEDDDDSDWSVGRTSPTWDAPKPFTQSDALYKRFPEKVKNPKSDDMSWDAEELFDQDKNPKPEEKDGENA